MSRRERERGREELVDGLSRRFIELRRRAGMTQQGVADAMGKTQAGKRLARRLERGAVENAGLLTVAEYLRAVRAGFGDLKDVLDRYTSLPIPEPARKLAEAAPLPRLRTGARTWESGDSPRGTRPRSDARNASRMCPRRADARYSPRFPDKELAVLRMRRRAGYWVLRRVFEHYLHSGLHAAGVPAASGFRRSMAAYGRRVFNAYFRTRGPREPKRPQRLARLREWADRRHFDRTLAEYMEFVASFAFDDMREHDELDWLPPPDEAFAIMAVKPKHRVVTDAQMCLAEWWEAFNRYSSATQEVYARAHKAATDVVAATRCDARTAFRYKLAVTRTANSASFTAPDTKERRRSVADFNTTDWPPEMDRRLLARALAAALEVWDASRPTLPPSPGPKPV